MYLVIFCIPLIGFSQTEIATKSTDDLWDFNITLYLWITGLKGEWAIVVRVSVGGFGAGSVQKLVINTMH